MHKISEASFGVLKYHRGTRTLIILTVMAKTMPEALPDLCINNLSHATAVAYSLDKFAAVKCNTLISNHNISQHFYSIRPEL